MSEPYKGLNAALARTAPDAAGIEAALADVLAAHYTYTAGRGMTVRCKCGEVVGERGGRASIGNSATHRAHVAAALLPVVTQAQAAERERVAKAIEGATLDATFLSGSEARGWWRGNAEAARIARADESGA